MMMMTRGERYETNREVDGDKTTTTRKRTT